MTGRHRLETSMTRATEEDSTAGLGQNPSLRNVLWLVECPSMASHGCT